MIDKFKTLVDNSTPTINLIKNDLKALCEAYGIDTSSGYSRHSVTEKIYSEIRSALTGTENEVKIRKSDVFKLKNGLIYQHVIFGEPINPYSSVLSVIRDACRTDDNYFPVFDNEEKWALAINKAKDYLSLSPDTFSTINSFEQLRKDYSRATDVAESLKFLIDKGCEVEIVDSEVHINGGLEPIIDELDGYIKSVGGITLSRILFGFLKEHAYSSKLSRYRLGRNVSIIGYDRNRQLPYGYLLNKSVQYPYEFKGKKGELDELINKVVELSKHLCSGVFDVQPYHTMELLMNNGETIVKFIEDTGLYDSIYTIPQCRPDLALRINQHLFGSIDDKVFSSASGFSFDNFQAVHSAINNLSKTGESSKTIYLSAVVKEVKPIGKTTVQKILNALSHSVPPNDNYQLPSDYPKIDFFLKPLIKMGDTKFLLMDASWCSSAYYEVLATILRGALRDFDSNVLGHAIETTVYEFLDGRGITYVSGEFSSGGVDGESDGIVETDEAIILIEIKKKVLTRNAKSGDTNSLMLDLADSLMASQIQAGKAEIILREEGQLELTNDEGEKYTVHHNGRKIERLTLTHLEYGGFQDRGAVHQFLGSFFTHSYRTHSEDPHVIKKFEKLAKKQKEWNVQATKLQQLNPKKFNHFPFFDSWFLSLPQFLHVVELAKDNNSFYEIFIRTKHMTTGSMDFYREFELANQMRE